MAPPGDERQKRYIQRLKDAAANNGTANPGKIENRNMPPAPVIDIPAIEAWWKAASASQRRHLCEQLGAVVTTTCGYFQIG